MAKKSQLVETGKKVLPWAAAAVGAYFGIRFIKKLTGPSPQKTTEYAQTTTIPTTTTPSGTVNLYDTAIGIAEALGTNVGWWNPYNWSEDEVRAMELIMSVPKSSVPQVEQIYAGETDRVLRTDLQTLLSDQQWNTIKGQFA